MNDAIGLIETKGLLALIEATDAMAKAANVEITKRVDIGGGLVTTVVSGDVGSVRAAVEAGRVRRRASRRIGQQPHHPASIGRSFVGFFGLSDRPPKRDDHVQPTSQQRMNLRGNDVLILVANLGSTSFKYRLFDMTDQRCLARGAVDRIGESESSCSVEIGDWSEEKKQSVPDHGVAVAACLRQLTDPDHGVIGDASEVDAIGFKAVHGGRLSGVFPRR